MSTVLIIGAVLIVLILSAIAWYYQSRVNKMEAAKKEQLREINELKNNHQQYLNNSIQVLAQGLIDDQLSLTEGAIRISVLMDNLDINDEHRDEFSVFFQLAEATAHIPILDAWKKLPKKEKSRYEKERMATEDNYREFIIDAAKRIKGRRF